MRRTRVGMLGTLALAAVFAPAQVNVSTPASVKTPANGSTAAAVPATADYAGANSSGNLAGIVACDSSAQLTMSTATTTQMVALASGKAIYVCGFAINGGGVTTAKLVAGTGTNCGTGTTTLTPAFSLATATTVAMGGG